VQSRDLISAEVEGTEWFHEGSCLTSFKVDILLADDILECGNQDRVLDLKHMWLECETTRQDRLVKVFNLQLQVLEPFLKKEVVKTDLVQLHSNSIMLLRNSLADLSWRRINPLKVSRVTILALVEGLDDRVGPGLVLFFLLLGSEFGLGVIFRVDAFQVIDMLLVQVTHRRYSFFEALGHIRDVIFDSHYECEWARLQP
jgi:hypothetical protein